MKSKSSALSFLYGLQKFGIKLGLRNIEYLLGTLGNPQNEFPSIHLAGTNGKGSTSSMIAAALTAAGYKVGLYTSPHLVDFNERIRIGGRMITDASLIRYANRIKPAVEECRATFFEATTAIAFRHFADRKVDIAVVETGLGGRLDATNTLMPLVSIITSIGKDHTEILGPTIGKIAREKGGIIKPGVPCVLGRMPAAAKKVLERLALANSSPVISVENIAVNMLQDGSLTVQTPGHRYTSITLSLRGDFQKDNAAAALAALEQLDGSGFSIPDRAVREGFASVERLTGLKARLQIVGRRPLLICDVAHNPDAAQKLSESIRTIAHRNVHLIFGVMKDKEYHPMIRSLGAVNPNFYAVEASIARSLSAQELCGAIEAEGYHAERYATIAAALRAARKNASDDDMIVVTGSHYVVGEAISALSRTKRSSAGARKKFT